MNLLKHIASWVLIGVLGFTLSAPTTLAVTRTQLDIDPTGDFVIGPGKLDLSLEPGESTTRQITVTNRTENETSFSVTKEDFTAREGANTAVQLLGDQKGPNTLRDFLGTEVQEFTLTPGEQITFNVSVRVPVTAEPGGLYGAVIISNEPQIEQVGGASTRVISRLASLFLVRVEGDVTEEGSLEDFRLLGPSSVRTDGPFEFEILYENTGNVHLIPYGQIEITNLFGQTVGLLPIDAYFALPDALRYRQVSWTPGFLLGYYKANLKLYKGYGPETNTELASLGFWVIPWRVIAGALIVVLLIVGLVRWLKRTFEFRRK